MPAPRAWLLWSLAGAAVLFMLSRTQKGQQIAADAVGAVASAVRGIRNNNPGNIREAANGGDAWKGERATDDDPAFEEFAEMRYGVRAAAKVFRKYQSSYNLRTVAQLIARWAPPSENDTGSYINAVAKRVGVDAYAPIDLSNAEVCYRFLRAVFRHECGIAAEAIPESTIREGIMLP
jgi:hypothetical protein